MDARGGAVSAPTEAMGQAGQAPEAGDAASAALEATALECSLASALASYPDAEVAETVRALREALASHPVGQAFVRALDEPGGLDELRSSFVGWFDQGERRISLYGTEYGRMRGMSKGPDLAALTGLYRAFGVTPDSDASHEAPDHLAVELEFYAFLLEKERYLAAQGDDLGVSTARDGRKLFLREYLAPLAAAVAKRFEGVGEGETYPELFRWIAARIADECDELEVTPVPLDFFEDPDAKGDLSCGSSCDDPTADVPGPKGGGRRGGRGGLPMLS